MRAAVGVTARGTACALASMIAAGACGARSELPEEQGAVGALDGSAYAEVASDAASEVPAHDAAPMCSPLGDGGACNRLSPTGAPVTVACAPPDENAPTPRGGAIPDGTYVLVSSRLYGGCSAADSERVTWTICGRAWSTVQEGRLGGKATTQHLDGDVLVSGARFTFSPTCPPNGVPVTMFGYDATPTTLTIYVYGYGPGRVRVDGFVRQ